VSKAKDMFQKISAIVVIAYLAYFIFFIKIQKELVSLYKEISGFFWFIVKANSVSIIIFSVIIFLIAISYINWILDDNVKKRKKKTQKKEEKQDQTKEVE